MRAPAATGLSRRLLPMPAWPEDLPLRHSLAWQEAPAGAHLCKEVFADKERPEH